jgi:hypothetical protein
MTVEELKEIINTTENVYLKLRGQELINDLELIIEQIKNENQFRSTWGDTITIFESS